MPAAISYVPPTSKDRNGFNGAISKERQRRKEDYETALQYYLGRPDFQVKYDPEDVEYDPALDNTTVNLTKMAADRTVSFLFPDVPEFQTDPKSIEDTPEEAWLKDTFIPENGGLAAFNKLALRGFLAGHCFVWLKPVAPTPRMVILQPLSVTVFWRADDVSDVLWYEMRYIAQNRLFIRDFVKQDNGTWLIYEYESQANKRSLPEQVLEQITAQGGQLSEWNLDGINFGASFKPVGSPKVHSSVIPPIIDIAHLPHPDDFYGQGEFTQKSLQDIINAMLSVRNRIVRENSDPVDVVDGDVDDIEDKGSIIVIPKGSKVTRLQLSADLVAINSTINDLIEKYLAVARVVILKGEAKDLQRVTNAAVRTLFLDALAKNEVLKATYGFALSRIAKLALIMAYALKVKEITANPEDIKVSVLFGEPLPKDMTEIANVNAIGVNGGWRSKYSAQIAEGLNPEFEQIKLTSEREEAMAQAQEDLDMQADNAIKIAGATTQPPKSQV